VQNVQKRYQTRRALFQGPSQRNRQKLKLVHGARNLVLLGDVCGVLGRNFQKFYRERTLLDHCALLDNHVNRDGWHVRLLLEEEGLSRLHLASPCAAKLVPFNRLRGKEVEVHPVLVDVLCKHSITRLLYGHFDDCDSPEEIFIQNGQSHRAQLHGVDFNHGDSDTAKKHVQRSGHHI
jgi:hypothetical protein